MFCYNYNILKNIYDFFFSYNTSNSGTLKERGIEAWQKMIDDKADDMEEFDGDFTIYDIPLPQFLKRSKLFRRLPFIPPVRD